MHVGVQIERFEPARGGAEGVTAALVRRLLAGGHGVTVFCRFAPRPGDLASDIAIRVVVPWTGAAMAAAVREAGCDVTYGVGSGGPACDVLHAQFGAVAPSQDGMLDGLRPRWWRGPAAWLDGFNPRRGLLLRAERDRLTGAATGRPPDVIAVSGRCAAALAATGFVDPARLHVVPNGADADRFHPADRQVRRGAARRRFALPDGCAGPVAGHAGSPPAPPLSWGREAAGGDGVVFALAAHNAMLKGLPEAIEALSLLLRRRPDLRGRVRLLVAGRVAVPLWQAFARLHGVSGSVGFAGPVADMRDVWAAADACLHPTWYDACSVAVIEAWAAGLPVITTARNGAAELDPGRLASHVVATPDRIDGLAAAMEGLLDPRERERRGRAGRQVAERWSEDRSLVAVEGLLMWRATRGSGAG